MQYPSYFVNVGPGSNWKADFTTGYASVFVNVQPFPLNYNTLFQFFSSNVAALIQQLSDFQYAPGWENGKNASLGNNPALSVQFAYVASDGSPWEGWRIYMLSGNYVYTLTYLAPSQYFNNYIDDVRLMANSFTLTG